MPDLIVRLDDPSASVETVGGKGASLARLAGAGLPVPDGFYLTTEAYRQFAADNGLQPLILDFLGGIDLARPATFDEASRAIAARFASASMPASVADAIANAYAALPGAEPAVAVRSSATAEDLADLSFAGQQETFLNIRGRAAVQDAVKRCWASLWTARAIGYRAQHQVDQSIVSLAVVVQLLVPAEAAGVLFTANPVTGARDQAMLTATWGLGEAIVSSAVTPDTLLVDKQSLRLLSRDTADKRVMTVRTADGTHDEPTPLALRHKPVLDDRRAAQLAALGNRIEQLYGLPMDIEWATTGAGDADFAILQARPITALPAPPLDWPLPKPGNKYARASIIELLPEPLTPLFGTLGVAEINRGYQRMGAAMFQPNVLPETFVVLINDYAYYDITFSPRQTALLLLDMPRFGTFLLRTAERRWREEGRRQYAETVARWQRDDIASLPARDLIRGVHEIFAAAMDHYIYTVQGGILPAAYLTEAAFSWFYEHLVRRPPEPPALTFVLGFDSLPIRAEKSLFDLAAWCRAQAGLADLLVRTPTAELAAWLAGEGAPDSDEWQAFASRFAVHQAQFGYTIYDLDFAKATPADDPRPVLETLKHHVQGHGADPHRRQHDAAARREQAMRAVHGRLRGWRRVWFRRLLGWAQRYAPLREDALAETGLGWPLVRSMLLELGNRLRRTGALTSADDAFWLTEAELLALASDLDAGAAALDSQDVRVVERKERIATERRQTPPTALPPKVTFAGFDFSAFMPTRADQQTGNTIKGLGASPGTVTATARVLRGPDDFGEMRQGDVLVAAITTPAWTPLFALASAVVTDVGGPLSHSSIVAREYGVPAVLGTGVATQRIHSGDLVTVDGTTGTVTLPG